MADTLIKNKQWLCSKYSQPTKQKWNIRGHNLNQWCEVHRLFGSESILLHPNAIGDPWPVLWLEHSIPRATYDSLSLIVSTGDERLAGIKFLAKLFNEEGATVDSCMVELQGDQETSIKLCIPSCLDTLVIELSVGCLSYVPTHDYGKVVVRDCILYKDDELTRLAGAYLSDKGVSCGVHGNSPHGYTKIYHELFDSFRHKEISLLEIGLQASTEHSGVPDDAPSMRMWRDYFPNAFLYGFDKNDFSFFSQEKTLIFQGDQGSRSDLGLLVEQFSNDGLDVIVDDGSHMSSHQQITLASLFPVLNSGGLYIVEDLSWQPKKEKVRTVDLFADYINNGSISPVYMNKAQSEYLASNISALDILKPNDMEVLVLRKK